MSTDECPDCLAEPGYWSGATCFTHTCLHCGSAIFHSPLTEQWHHSEGELDEDHQAVHVGRLMC